MADNLFSKIKKSFNFFANKSDENVSENIKQDQGKISEITENTDTDLLNNKNVTENIDSLINIKPLFVEKESKKTLTFNYNNNISSSLKSILKDDKEFIYCCIVNKKEFSVIASYNKREVENEFIIQNVNSLLSLLLNDNLNKIVRINSENFIDRILTINDNNSQYVNIMGDEIIILITNQKNQLLTWKLIDEIKECTLF